jgi:hypothetical protein
MQQRLRRGLSWQAIALGVCLVLTVAGFIAAAYLILPTESDWSDAYRPAALNLLAGESPYNLSATRPFLNGPWILIPLIPFAVLPPQLGRALIFVASLVCYSVIAIKLGARPLALMAFLASYPVIYGLIYGQIDGLISLGLLLPPPIGLVVLTAKPQLGLGVAIFWLVEAWRTGGWRKVLATISPTGLVFLISFVLYGNWLIGATFPLSQTWNTSLWPQSIPVGLLLIAWALRRRNNRPAIMASPFLSPYLAAHSWAVALLGLLPDSLLMIIGSAGIWITWLLGGGPAGK